MASKKYKITQLQEDESLLELHPATDADIVSVESGSSAYKGSATDVQGALEEVYDLASQAASSGVTGVKGDAESTYRTGQVNLTPANLGAQAAFSDGTATIATESNGVVTIKGGVKQTNGSVSNKSTSEASDITLGTVAKKTATTSMSSTPSDSNVLTEKAVSGLLANKSDKSNTVTNVNYDSTNNKITKTINGTTSDVVSAATLKTAMALNNVTNNKQVKAINSSTNGNIVTFGGTDGATIADSGTAISTTAPSSTSTDTQIPTSKAVNSAITAAIDAMPEPMIFKGSVGASGTVTWADLPTAAASNEGHTYKVITVHTADTKCPACKVGDTIISNGTAWVVIPSGDEPSGTVTSVGLSAPTGFSVSGSPVTGNGTLTLGFASGYSLPTTAKQSEWDAKQDALDPQTAYTAKGSATKVPQITTNALGQVTSITEVTITDNNDNQKVKTGDVTFGVNDVVNFVAGSNVTVTGNATNKTITIAATDTTYESKSAAQGGTAVSLVTTGEKYTWNNKAAGDHTHTTSITAGGTSTINLSANTAYTLTAGGTSVVFKTPSDSNTHNTHKIISGTNAAGADIASATASNTNITLGDSGVTAGVYSAIQVNSKGIAIKGANSFEVGDKSGTNTPSANLVVGGIFYQEI